MAHEFRIVGGPSLPFFTRNDIRVEGIEQFYDLSAPHARILPKKFGLGGGAPTIIMIQPTQLPHSKLENCPPQCSVVNGVCSGYAPFDPLMGAGLVECAAHNIWPVTKISTESEPKLPKGPALAKPAVLLSMKVSRFLTVVA